MSINEQDPKADQPAAAETPEVEAQRLHGSSPSEKPEVEAQRLHGSSPSEAPGKADKNRIKFVR